jgi:hypothetical protein
VLVAKQAFKVLLALMALLVLMAKQALLVKLASRVILVLRVTLVSVSRVKQALSDLPVPLVAQLALLVSKA